MHLTHCLLTRWKGGSGLTMGHAMPRVWWRSTLHKFPQHLLQGWWNHLAAKSLQSCQKESISVQTGQENNAYKSHAGKEQSIIIWQKYVERLFPNTITITQGSPLLQPADKTRSVELWVRGASSLLARRNHLLSCSWTRAAPSLVRYAAAPSAQTLLSILLCNAVKEIALELVRRPQNKQHTSSVFIPFLPGC